MARIPDEELERLKREVSLARLCGRYGVELSPHGKDLIGRCPFHEDREPSFVVTPAKNLWHCLGQCGSGGSVVDFVMRMEKASFRRAVEILREAAGLAPPAEKLRTRQGAEHPILVENPTDLPDRDLLGTVADYYHKTLSSDAKALDYLRRRACFLPEAINRFRLGYANRTLGYRVPATTAAGKALRSQLQRLGVQRESGHEHFSGSLVIPILDRHGGVVQMYGRKITPNLREGTPRHLYLPGPHRGVWNEAALLSQKEWLLCESLIDALTLYCAGFRNATASYGVNGFTADHWRLVDEVRPSRIVLLHDADAAGNAAAEALAAQLRQRGIEPIRARLPEGRDVNDVARQAGDRTAALAAVIEGGEPLGGAERIVVAMPGESPEESRRADAHASSLSSLAAEKNRPEAGDRRLEEEEAAAEEAAKEERDADVSGLEVSPSAAAVSSPSAASSSAASCACASAPDCALPPAASLSPDGSVRLALGERSWRIRGLEKNTAFDAMKVNVRVSRGEAFHIDTLDLYNARARQGFVTQASAELAMNPETLRKDLGRLLLALEALQEEAIRKALEPAAPGNKVPAMSPEERREALDLATSPDLVERLVEDMGTCGLAGEMLNKPVVYLGVASRKLPEPLALLIQSTSAAGKTALMEAALAMVPEEDRVKYSAMTGQSLYYLGDMNLKHKVLAIAEEEGAMKASYALKLLQSEGELSIASTGKDPATGRMVTQEYRVEGPVMIVTTTTSIEIDEELANRCIVLTVDESREQTRAIHRAQRESRTLEGLAARSGREHLRRVHRNFQRLLRPLAVHNPWAPRLTFLDDTTRTRRDHAKYLGLIDAIAFVHQHQRPVKTMQVGGRTVEYVDATVADVALANRLAAEALGRSLDELAPQTRRFLDLLFEMVQARCRAEAIGRGQCRFTQRQAREATGWSQVQVKRHMACLADLEYVLVHRGGRGQSFEYELLYGGEGRNAEKFVMGLIDVAKLGYDVDRDREKARWDRPGTPEGPALYPRSTGRGQTGIASSHAGWRETGPAGAEIAHQEPPAAEPPSYCEAVVPEETAAAKEEKQAACAPPLAAASSVSAPACGLQTPACPPAC